MSESHPSLHMTVGLPRSGKSTWAREQGWPIVNPDSIRLAIHGTAYRAEVEPLVWATAKLMVAALFLAGHRNVILDATNTTRERRDQWKDVRWERVFNEFIVPVETCIERAVTSGKEELIPVIRQMAKFEEPVDPNENWND